MEELLGAIMRVALFLLFLALLPAILVVATPFILLWPGKRRPDGTRMPRRIGEKYLKILRLWTSFGTYIP